MSLFLLLRPGGGGLRSGPLYGILRMEESVFLGVCRGVIGSGQRVCLRRDCLIASHTTKKVDWASIAGDESQCVFIRGSSGSDGDENPSIFANPSLPSSLIRKAEWSELETSPRSLESWQATFSALKESAMASGSDTVDSKVVAHVLEDTKTGINFVYTPARKKVRLPTPSDDTLIPDVASRSGEDSLVADTRAAVKMERAAASVAFIDVPEDLGNQPTPAFRTLSQGAWRDLLSNVSALKSAVEEEKVLRRSFRGKHDEQLDTVHMKLSVLHELLGERPTSFGTLSAFGLIEQLTSSTHTLASMLEDSKKAASSTPSAEILGRISTMEGHLANLKTNVEKIVSEHIERFMTTGDFRLRFVEPTMRLLTRSSLTTSDPGGKWDGELRDLKRRIDMLESRGTAVASSGQPTATSMFAWGTTGVSAAPLSPPNATASTTNGGSVITALKEEIEKLKADVKDLQDQSESDAIVVGSIVFASRKFCDTWLTLHSAVGDPHVFVDAISLLSLATSDASMDEGQAANQRATTARVKDKTPYHTAYIASFNLEVPPLLGKGSDSSMTTNSRALAGVPKFVDFHPPSGREGIHQRVLDYVKDGRKTLEQAIGDLFSFGSEPSSVARELLLLSKTFWDELCHWMVRYHREIKEESDATEHEVWILISHCVRAVFKSLRDARAPGRASNTPGGMLWGTLKAHETMREYRSHDFSGHPRIALILHEHLIRFSTPRSKFDELRNSFDEKLDKITRSVNQAVASVNKKGSGGGSKAGTSGEAKK